MSFCLFFPKKSQRPLLLFLKLFAFSEHQLIFDVPPLPLGCLRKQINGLVISNKGQVEIILVLPLTKCVHCATKSTAVTLHYISREYGNSILVSLPYLKQLYQFSYSAFL